MDTVKEETMEEAIQILRNVNYKLEHINIRGSIIENAPAYNDIIACHNTINKVIEMLKKPEEPAEDQVEWKIEEG